MIEFIAFDQIQMSIKVKNLTKLFQDQVAVDALSFTVDPSEIVGFLGPNGAGKSTTMKVITGYTSPTSGQIEVCGLSMLENSKAIRHKIGYLPEHNPLYLEMYISEYLHFFGPLYDLRGKALRHRIREIIELCGLTPERSKKIGQLSKGYRQRVGIAQALLHNPEVLILDEPTSGLDPNQLVEIRNLIKEISPNKSVLFSSHILSEVEAICDRVIIINKGKMVADRQLRGANMEHQVYTILVTFKEPPTDNWASSLQCKSAEKIDHQQFKIIAETDVRAEIFQQAVHMQNPILELKLEENDLEKLFQQLTVP